MGLQENIKAAQGKIPVDLLIKNANLINVLSGEIHKTNIAIYDGLFVGFGNYTAKQEYEASEKYLCPGLIDGHIHIESSLLSPKEFAKIVAQHGTAAVICDPHEIVNVLGLKGFEYMLQTSQDLPVDVYFMSPSCVPSTDMETSGAKLTASDIQQIFDRYPERVLGLAEVMNFPGVIQGQDEVLDKIKIALNKVIDGHCPGLRDKDLNAYIVGGPCSDHESCFLEEAREKIRKGMHIMIREGSSEKNLLDLLPLINEFNTSNISMVTDDRHPNDLLHLGHLDYTLRKAIQAGLNPISAIQMATINTAKYFGLKKRGAVALGYKADFILINELKTFEIEQVFLNGKMLADTQFDNTKESSIPSSINIGYLSQESFRIKSQNNPHIKAIEVIPDQILTKRVDLYPCIESSYLIADLKQDLAKLAVIERHHGSGNIGLGFVKGLGINCGAIAESIAHDSHNLIIAGMNDQDMYIAAKGLQDIGGGLIVVSQGHILAQLPLPIAGLMSTEGIEQVVEQLTKINKATSKLGVPQHINIFMLLSFLSLPVIPEIRLTDKGLVDVNNFELTSLYS